MKRFKVLNTFYINGYSILIIDPSEENIRIGDTFLDDDNVEHRIDSIAIKNFKITATEAQRRQRDLVIYEPNLKTEYIKFI